MILLSKCFYNNQLLNKKKKNNGDRNMQWQYFFENGNISTTVIKSEITRLQHGPF